MVQSTRDHDAEPSTAQSTSQHAQRGDAASDADSEDDLLNQVPLQNQRGYPLSSLRPDTMECPEGTASEISSDE